jgi:hypothetical protein
MVLWLRKEIDFLKLRRRHMAEQFSLRYEGLKNGVVVWETTANLCIKAALYTVLTVFWWLFGALADLCLSRIGEASRLDD